MLHSTSQSRGSLTWRTVVLLLATALPTLGTPTFRGAVARAELDGPRAAVDAKGDDRTPWRQSLQNLAKIGEAMAVHHKVYGCFPAAATYHYTGKPLLSWRVSLLPFLGEAKLYEQFHLNEPWDSEHNRKLIEQMPNVYHSPNSNLHEKGMTNYVVPVGQPLQTAFYQRAGIRLWDIKDGTSQTIMAVEVKDEHAVTWTKPQDLAFDREQPARGLAGPVRESVVLLLFDGTAGTFKINDIEILRGLFTPALGEATSSGKGYETIDHVPSRVRW